MGNVKVRYLVIKTKRGKQYHFWQPKNGYYIDGKWQETPKSLRACALGCDPVIAHGKARELYLKLTEWRCNPESKQVIVKGTVDWLIVEYRKDERYTGLRPSTQKLYDYTLKELSGVFGDIPADKVSRHQVRAFYQSFAGTVRKASQVMQVSRVVFSFGKDMELITENPFAEQRVKKAKPRRMIISDEQIELAKAKAIEMGLSSIAYAIQIAFDGGQRPGDIRNMRRTDYDGKWLSVTQSKTGAFVSIPVYKMPTLKRMLDELSHESVLILHEERTGKPYSKDMLCRRVREVFIAAGISSDLQFRDLRRTAFVRLIESGCSIPEACSITGHSLNEGNDIVEVYCPLTKTMAENAAGKRHKVGTAIVALENKVGTEK